MTIKTYLDALKSAKMVPGNPDGPSFVETVMDMAEIWSNGACQGYFIQAAKIAGLDDESIRKILSAFGEAFEDLTVDEADKLYCNY